MCRGSAFLAFFFLFALNFINAEGYEEFKSVGMSYKFHTTPLKWAEARTKCVSEGASLAMPRNQAEANVLIELFARHPANTLNAAQKDYMLIGFHSIFDAGQYVTVNGGSLDKYYNTWASGEPNYWNRRGIEDCGSMQRSGGLNDFTCNTPSVFVCEKPLSNRIEPVEDLRCPSKGYTYYESTQKCYKMHKTPKKWSHAQAICDAEGAHLAIINSETERIILSNMINTNRVLHTVENNLALLGFHDMFEQGHYVTVLGENLASTGYTRWTAGEPNNKGNNEHCGSMFLDGTLNDIGCTIEAVFICEQPQRTYI